MDSLCENSVINSGGNLEKSVVVFRGGKVWEFDGKPIEGRPLGKLMAGGKVASDRWPGIKFPGGVCHRKENMVMIYDKKFSQWSPKGTPEDLEQPVEDPNAGCGTAIDLGNNKIAVTYTDKVSFIFT